MLSTAHTLLSVPLGLTLDNPLIIFLAAMVLHLLADTLLHWNIYPEKGKSYPFFRAGLDVSGGFVIAWLLLGERLFTLPVLAAIAGGNFPDILHAGWELLSAKQKKYVPRLAQVWFSFHEKLQHETTATGFGLISQVATSVIAITIILTV